MPSIRLLVISPFGGHAAGDRITDLKAMEVALRDHPTSVLREPYEPEPAAAPDAKPSAKPAG